MISVLGIPYDEDSSFLKGARLGPEAIRQAFHSAASNLTSETGAEFSENAEVEFCDDLSFDGKLDPRVIIEQRASELLSQQRMVLSLGGDHSITYPLLRAYAAKFGAINVLQIDAHSDLYEEFNGNRYSHACPFARAQEDGIIQRHVQIGIRTMNRHQQEQAHRFAVEVIPMNKWGEKQVVEFAGPVYVTLDLDALDPAFAPGISHYEPGGATVRQVIELIHNIDAKIIGADIVELNPKRDFQQMTAIVAAKFMKELLARMLGPKF